MVIMPRKKCCLLCGNICVIGGHLFAGQAAHNEELLAMLQWSRLCINVDCVQALHTLYQSGFALLDRALLTFVHAGLVGGERQGVTYLSQASQSQSVLSTSATRSDLRSFNCLAIDGQSPTLADLQPILPAVGLPCCICMGSWLQLSRFKLLLIIKILCLSFLPHLYSLLPYFLYSCRSSRCM